ncbi:MAG: winged helix-turn-helix domain-containing protein [Candidatus Heimdallarchaeota archaeon]
MDDLEEILGHKIKLRIIGSLLRSEGLYVRELAKEIDMAASTLLPHLAALEAHSIIRYEHRGPLKIYSITENERTRLIKSLFDAWEKLE